MIGAGTPWILGVTSVQPDANALISALNFVTGMCNARAQILSFHDFPAGDPRAPHDSFVDP